MDIKRVVLLKGGWSHEREVSLASATGVANSLRRQGFDVYEIDVQKDLKLLSDELFKANPDVVFNSLHGVGAEDGVIQGMLEIFGKPYTHSGVGASAICFDKDVTKNIATGAGVTVAKSVTIHQSELAGFKNPFDSFPIVMKPACNGSSVGVFIIHDENDLKLKSNGWEYGDKILVEEYIRGRELTALVMNGKAVGSLEIKARDEFYNYDSKYAPGGSIHDPNYDINPEHKAKMHEAAEIVHKAAGCKGVTRSDFLYDGNDVYFLEINTIPGMTEVSLAPDIYRSVGKSYDDLILDILMSAV